MITASEADHLVKNLVKFQLKDIGTPKWMLQHETLERLNIEAHKNIVLQVEEFVTESIILYEMTETLVHDLILIDTWKTAIYPKINSDLINRNSLSVYFILYHEATVANLLELILFNESVCMAANDAIFDIVDYASKRINSLLVAKKTRNGFEGSLDEMMFSVSISCISMMRYITDNIQKLPFGVMSDLLGKKDMVCTLVYLLEAAPWVRKGTDLQIFDNGSWKSIKKQDLQVIGKIEAQVWLAIMNLLLEPECRKNYAYNTKNHAIVLRLKNYVTETSIDQLPPLVDLARYLEELVMLIPSEQRNMPVMISSVSSIEQELLSVDQNELVTKFEQMLSRLSQKDNGEIASRLAQMYDISNIEPLLDDPKCGKCGSAATSRCSKCKTEWYCGRACQVKAWSEHKGICQLIVPK